ncbi:transcriptional regulator [Streptomyces sp. NPDC002785]|uniref:transcriptional regulator n=1 Tax=Streptomyces sp. NPDC002785 TaxID=3154543 RepID=UPI00332C18DB
MIDPCSVGRPRFDTAKESGGPAEDVCEGDEQPADDLEQTLMEVRRLIEATVVKHRDRVVRDSLITAVSADCGEVASAALGLVAEAERTIDIVLADSEHVEAIRSVYWELAPCRKNIELRLLCTQAMLDDGVVQLHMLEGLPYEVRVARVPMLQVLIVDGSAALVTAQSVVGRRASVIRATTVIRTLDTLFEGLWRHAVPVEERIDFGDRGRADAARQILNCLQVGITDEVAARELSVSVRTYRRYVAEIMALLGASSRFQAGVRAAELGLLPKGRQGSGHLPAGLAKGGSGLPVQRGARRQDVPARGATRDARGADGTPPRNGPPGAGSFL